MSMTKETFLKLADEVATNFVANQTPLNESIKVTAIKMEMNPEQIKRLVESSNVTTYNKLYEKADQGNREVSFPLADSNQIIKDIYSGDDEHETSRGSNEKSMPDVQFAPDTKGVTLNATNEMSQAKEHMLSDNKSGLGKEDSLLPPKKNYSLYDTHSEDDDFEQDPTDKTLEEEGRKEASDQSIPVNVMDAWNCPTKLAEVHSHLQNAIILQSDRIVDTYKKVASLFTSRAQKEMYGDFILNTKVAFHQENDLNLVLETIAHHANIESTSVTQKMARDSFYGRKQVASLIEDRKKLAHLIEGLEQIASRIETLTAKKGL
jgi:hypothetical protein